VAPRIGSSFAASLETRGPGDGLPQFRLCGEFELGIRGQRGGGQGDEALGVGVHAPLSIETANSGKIKVRNRQSAGLQVYKWTPL